ncbi:MAG: RagB/SusD family nutrient uptake outer membrane protein [Ignavibacteria bacterium]|nr:RagB/SusD family nutrient uptake outer membrane protein [Ignavibacteria bacterium]
MKTSKIIFITILLLALGFIHSGCNEDFLNQDPQTSLSDNQVFESLDNVQFFLDGLYFEWRFTRVNRRGFYLMLGTDESQQGEYQMRTEAEQGGLDKYDGFYSEENKPIAELWSIRWPIVVKAGMAIDQLNKLLENASKEDSARINSFKGQASFYRGAVLLELASYWGELPIPETTKNSITLSAKRSIVDTYRMIENDLLTASQLLSDKLNSADLRIPTKWAAMALLGKMYMSVPLSSGLRNYGNAKLQFLEIYNHGGFSLATNVADLWDPTKQPGNEPIFTFYFTNTSPDTNQNQWYTGSRACAGNPTNYIGGYDLVLPTEYCRNDIEQGGLWEKGDLRKMESIRYDFINGDNLPSPVAGFGEDQLLPHIKKYEDKRIDSKQSFYDSGKNIYYVRYADVLLSLAECMNETNETSAAVQLINNTIRNRAWGGTLPSEYAWNPNMSQEDFRKNIMTERMRELCFEGWRRFDLIRTNNFVNYIKERNRWAKEASLISEQHIYYPIPITEIKMNPNLSENK